MAKTNSQSAAHLAATAHDLAENGLLVEAMDTLKAAVEIAKNAPQDDVSVEWIHNMETVLDYWDGIISFGGITDIVEDHISKLRQTEAQIRDMIRYNLSSAFPSATAMGDMKKMRLWDRPVFECAAFALFFRDRHFIFRLARHDEPIFLFGWAHDLSGEVPAEIRIQSLFHCKTLIPKIAAHYGVDLVSPEITKEGSSQ